MKKIILLLLLCLIPFSVQASNELELKLLNECNLQYGGDKCVSELKITNNTNKDLEGRAIFTGSCNDQPLLETPVGIDVSFGLSNEETEWEMGFIIFPGFMIPQGETLTSLEIITNPALLPGPYIFSLSVLGITDDEDYKKPFTVFSGGTVLIPMEEEEELAEESPKLTQEELRAKIRDLQWRIIFLLYQFIIMFIGNFI